jgi:hypothetical protein
LLAFVPLAAGISWAYWRSLSTGERLDLSTPLGDGSIIFYVDFSLDADVLRGWRGPAKWGWVVEWLVAASAFPALWAYLRASAGVAAWFVATAPDDVRRDRAVTLSRYAPSALAFVPAFAVCAAAKTVRAALAEGGVLEGLIQSPGVRHAAEAVSVAGVFGLCAVPMVWLLNTLILLHLAGGRSVARTSAAAVAVPAAWVLLAPILLLGIPLVAAYVGLIVLSLT